MKKFCYKFTLLLFVFAFLVGCGNEADEWNSLLKNRTAEACLNYIKKYPNSSNIDRVYRLLWEFTLEGEELERKHLEDIKKNKAAGRYVFKMPALKGYKLENPSERWTLFGKDGKNIEPSFYVETESGIWKVNSALSFQVESSLTSDESFRMSYVPLFLADGAVSYLSGPIPIKEKSGQVLINLQAVKNDKKPFTFVMIDGIGFVHIRGDGIVSDFTSGNEKKIYIGDFLTEAPETEN